MNTIANFILNFNFDYSKFDSQNLESKAKKALSGFLGFVRASFDGLIENGKALQEIYLECLESHANGRKVFDQWLSSPDFGQSRYIAKSAMTIYSWFEKLHPRMQRLVRQDVQQWSVSSLRKLTKLSDELVAELVSSGKKTAAQIQAVISKTIASDKPIATKESNHPVGNMPQTNSNTSEPEVKMEPGVRIVVTGDENGWNAHTGIIMSESSEGKFWVLLDHTVAQKMEIKHLFKAEQLRIQVKSSTQKVASEQLFTIAQVEEKIAQALAQQKLELKEEEIGRFVEIRDAALKSAQSEIQASHKSASKIAQEKEELISRLAIQEQELESIRSLQIKNQQLERRVVELEKALEDSNNNHWGNTLSTQAAKVVNSDLEKTIAPLMSEVERLQQLVQVQKVELEQLQTINQQQQEEITTLQESELEQGVERIIRDFGAMGEELGWNGWNRHGYRSLDGMLHKGIGAIACFVCDLKREYNQFEVAMHN